MVNWGKIIFGGIDSSDYGIYISGEAVYNAPNRAVEFVDVPGRNGAIAIDQGRFNNITVTYPSGTFGKTQEEFREAVSNFRNAIMSLRGYQKLEDTYHPEEYRMAVYISGLEVSPTNYGHAGEFDITFECKPQRWLACGDYPIPIKSGTVFENPTLFNSNPLLMVEGYGDIDFNGYSFTLTNQEVGYIILSSLLESFTSNIINANKLENVIDFNIPFYTLDVGDTFTVHGDRWYPRFLSSGMSSSATYAVQSNTFSVAPTIEIDSYVDYDIVTAAIRTTATSFVYGTSQNNEMVVRVTVPTSNGNKVYDVTVSENYNADSGRFTSSLLIEGVNGEIFDSDHTTVDIDKIDSTSTFSLLGHPTYLDCELGEAYKIEDGEIVSLNEYISMGSDLPVFGPGGNKVNYDNTITELKIAPRWWKV